MKKIIDFSDWRNIEIPTILKNEVYIFLGRIQEVIGLK